MGVVEQTGGRDEVLHVCGCEESQAAILAIGDLSDGEFNFDEVTVMTSPDEHGLLAKLNTGLVGRENALDDGPSFRGGVIAAVEARLRPSASVAVQAECRLAFGARSNFIGH